MRCHTLGFVLGAVTALTTPTVAQDMKVVMSAIQVFSAASEDAREAQLASLADVCSTEFAATEWNALLEILAREGLSPEATVNVGELDVITFVLQRDVALGDGLPRGELFLRFRVHSFRSLPSSGSQPTLAAGEPAVGIRLRSLATIDPRKFEDSLPARSQIREALRSFAVAETVKSLPILSDLELSASRAFDMALGESALGYDVRLTFTKSADELDRGARLTCRAAVPAADGQEFIDAKTWRRTEFVPRSDLDTLVSDLRALAKSKEDSLQVVLQRATRLVQRVASNRDRREVEASLEREGVVPYSAATSSAITYLVAKDAFSWTPGLRADFVIELRTAAQSSATSPTEWPVKAALAGIEIKVKQPFSAVRTADPFAEGTALHRALRVAEGREDPSTTPFLESISVRYQSLFNRFALDNPRGFVISMGFSDGEPDPIYTAAISFEIQSRLDPPGGFDFDLMVRDFQPIDELGPTRLRGSRSGRRTASPSLSDFALLRRGAARFRSTPSAVDPSTTLTVIGAGDFRSVTEATRSIQTEGSDLHDDDLAALAPFVQIESLDLTTCEGISDDGLRHLEAMRNLRGLALDGDRISGSGFSHLAALERLTKLRLRSAGNLSNAGFRELGTLKQLAVLELQWSRSLKDEHLEPLLDWTALKQLNLWGCDRLTDRGLATIAAIDGLEALTISHCAGVTATGIDALAKLPNLQDLTIGYFPIGDAEIRSLAQLPALEYLSLIGARLSEDGLRALSKLPKLKCLSIRSASGLRPGSIERIKAAAGQDFTLEN